MISNFPNNSINNINFKGYDARPLKGVMMRNAISFDLTKIAGEMKDIGAKHGFDVILESRVKHTNGEANASLLKKFWKFLKGETEYLRPWVQDILYFRKNKMLIDNNEYINHVPLCQNMGIKREGIPGGRFIAGGNLFLLQDGKTEKILIGGRERLRYAAKLFPGKDILALPQADFHIDLFVRPLKDNNIIVADDDLSIAMLQAGERRLENLLDKKPDTEIKQTLSKLQAIIKMMQNARKSENWADTNDVISTLQDEGYNVIRVPGRIYDNKVCADNPHGIFAHSLNFINAIAATDKNGEIVYISNKSNLLERLGISEELAKEAGLDFEAIFRKSVQEYIKPENVYFVKGGNGDNPKLADNISQILKESHGGIHCLCAEIPKDFPGN